MPIDVGRVRMVPIDSIIVGDRAREELGDLDGIEGSMKESGLTTPLTFKDNQDGTFTLLAGERRLTILKRNENTEVPGRIYDRDLTELEMKMIEKAENFHRKDMEYYELDRLTLEIHQMQQLVHGVKAPGPGQEGWSVSNTKELLGYASKGSISMAIKRAEARDAFPELFENCKTASDASKVLKKVDEAIVKQVIAQKLESQKSDSNLHQLSKCFIIRDFFEGVKEIPDGVFHLVEIDSPYAISLTKQKKKDGESQYQLNDYNEVDIEDYQQFMSNVFKQCYRVMTNHSWLICWFAPEPHFNLVYNELINAGFSTSRMCGIWVKPGTGQNMNPTIKLSNTYEMFFYASKGSPALNKAGRSNVFQHQTVPPAQKVHPTERPIELMKDIYETFSWSGSRILIPFLGSGNGILAANDLNMSPIGFELSKGYKDSFLVRVNNISMRR